MIRYFLRPCEAIGVGPLVVPDMVINARLAHRTHRNRGTDHLLVGRRQLHWQVHLRRTLLRHYRKTGLNMGVHAGAGPVLSSEEIMLVNIRWRWFLIGRRRILLLLDLDDLLILTIVLECQFRLRRTDLLLTRLRRNGLLLANIILYNYRTLLADLALISILWMRVRPRRLESVARMCRVLIGSSTDLILWWVVHRLVNHEIVRLTRIIRN
jgi:hypothetical protein